MTTRRITVYGDGIFFHGKGVLNAIARMRIQSAEADGFILKSTRVTDSGDTEYVYERQDGPTSMPCKEDIGFIDLKLPDYDQSRFDLEREQEANSVRDALSMLGHVNE